MITNFMDGDESIDDTWSVTLMKAGFGDSGINVDDTFDNTDTFATGATEGDTDMMGNWEAQFFGEVALDTDIAETGNQSMLPSGVAGRFNGHFVNGHALGAFGAEMDDN